MSQLPLTIFCIHGNHERRPETIKGYELVDFHEGKVFREAKYPNILFAKDAEIYNFNGNKTITIGGAYSVDKYYRLALGHNWFPDEQPSDEVKQTVEEVLNKANWNIDVVLSHTVPLKYEPVEVFLPKIDQSTVDKTAERWLDYIEGRLNYKKWYAGHYHTIKKIDKLEIMFENFDEFKLN